MIPSKYNLITQIDEDNFAIFNPLSGAFDIADAETTRLFREGKPRNPEEKDLWMARGYFHNTTFDEKLYVSQRYQEFIEETHNNQTQFLLVMSYGCNFDCAYCYQKGIDTSKNFITPKMIDSFVDFVIDHRDKNGQDVVVTLFGGEPLLPGRQYREAITQVVKRVSDAGIGLSVVTNGYHLADYVDILSKADIKEIHISVDGDEETHNKRRFTKDGKESFARIMNGIEKSLSAGFPIQARLITDRMSIKSFPHLAEILDQKGWLDLPKTQFKTSLGRNYELINEYMKPEDLFTLDEMISEYTRMMQKYPLMQKLHLPSFFGITHMLTEGEMYLPSFDTCPGAKSEFVFDLEGKIYSCTASCGRKDLALGTYYPELTWNEPELKKWKNRSILTIPECKDCSVGVVCGGGCAVIAKDRNGEILSPNCKPVKEVMDIGIQFYRETLLGK